MLLDSGNPLISKQRRIVEEETSEQKQPDPISLLLLSLEIAETNSCGMDSSTLNPRWSYHEWQVHPMFSLRVVRGIHGGESEKQLWFISRKRYSGLNPHLAERVQASYVSGSCGTLQKLWVKS